VTKETTIDQLKYAVQALSLDAEDQLASFPEFVLVTDELLLEFDNWKNVAVANYSSSFSQEQLEILNDIEALASNYDSHHSYLSIAEELKTSAFWKQLRVLAKDALARFSWSSEIPPDDRVTYVKG
jgi:hypothetical protein